MIIYLVLAVFLLLLVYGFVISSNKLINFFIVMFLCFFMSFTKNTADYAIYYRRFHSPSTEALEPLFVLLTKLFKFLGLNLQLFIIVIMSLYIYELYRYVNRTKFNKYMGFILCLYFIYPFCMDTAQIRNTLCFIPILIGMRYMENGTQKKQITGEVVFLICLLISTLLHYGGVFYILLYVAKKIDVKKSCIISIVSIFLLSITSNKERFILNLMSKIGTVPYNKVRTLFNNSIMQNQHTIDGTRRMMIVTFILIMFLLVFIYRKQKDEYVEYMIKVNILVMILVPLLDYAVDLFRIQRYILIFTYAGFATGLYPNIDREYSVNKKVLLKKCIMLSVPIIGLYLNVIRSDLFNYVIMPFIESNILF